MFGTGELSHEVNERDVKSDIRPEGNISFRESREYLRDQFDALKHRIEDSKTDHLQEETIRKTIKDIGSGVELTSAEKGNLGEMMMDQYYIKQGYRPIHGSRTTDLEHKSGQGIDGVYEKDNPDGSNSYVIADAKVNHSVLNDHLADGTRQMSGEWIDKRLDDAVGKEKADEIRDAYEDNPESVSSEVYRYSYGESEDGSSSAEVCTVNENGIVNDDSRVVQSFDSYGNELRR